MRMKKYAKSTGAFLNILNSDLRLYPIALDVGTVGMDYLSALSSRLVTVLFAFFTHNI